MFNLFGILVSLLISEYARGKGLYVGWPSVAAAAIGIAGVAGFLNVAASHVAGRLGILRLQAQAAMMQRSPETAEVAMRIARERDGLARRMPVMRLAADAMILGVFYVLAGPMGWIDYVHHAWGVPHQLALLPNLLPYFAMLAASWLAQVRVENALHGPSWRAMSYLRFQLRANLMTVAPLVIINAGFWAVLRWVPVAGPLSDAFLYADFVLTLAIMLPVVALMPLVLRLALPVRPLPPGPLRRSLEDFARRRGLRVGGLYEWQTGGRHFTTAFVIGLIPGLRYVFFTDALLRRFSDAEVLSVFAHEMGHVRHRHLWWLVSFIVAFSLGLLAIEELARAIGDPAATLGLGLLLFAWGYAVFGFISRRFERQADDYAARETSPELIAGVLLKIAAQNPAALNKRGWRHFPIRQRVAEIALAAQKPQVRRLFDAQRRRGLLLVAVFALGALAVLARPVREDVVSGLATFSLAQLDIARRAHAPADRIETLRERTLSRTAAMRELNEDYALAAQQYEGIVAGLTGQKSDALEQLAATARANAKAATTEQDRRKWEGWAESAQATEAALQAALRNNTPWEEEWRKELDKRR